MGQDPLDHEQFQALSYALVRPILVALTTVPLISADWQGAMRMFEASLDTTTEAFNAGKDLAIAPIDPSKVN